MAPEENEDNRVVQVTGIPPDVYEYLDKYKKDKRTTWANLLIQLKEYLEKRQIAEEKVKGMLGALDNDKNTKEAKMYE